MTKISLYPTDTNIETDDILIGTDKENSDQTKNFQVGDLNTFFLDSFIVVNRTTSELSLSTLNSTYGDYPIGTVVFCPSITTVSGQRFVYTKIDNNVWVYDTRPLVV